MSKAILFEDDQIRVIFRKGAANFLLISFGDRVNLANEDRFYAERPVENNNYSCLGFMAKSENWFPEASMKAATTIINNILPTFSKIVTFGGSMGGYAALKYSKLLNATHVIAHCPQWSIDPQDCGQYDRRYIKYYSNVLNKNMAIERNDVQGRLFIFFDPMYREDSFHVNKIKFLESSAELVKLYFLEHSVTTVLAGSKNLAYMIDGIIDDDKYKIIEFSAGLRRKSKYRLQNLIRTGLTRHPILLANISLHVPSKTDIENFNVHSTILLSKLIEKGKFSIVRKLIAKFNLQKNFAPFFDEYLLAAQGNQNQPFIPIRSFHQGYMAYDILNQSILGFKSLEDIKEKKALPILFDQQQEVGYIYTEISGKNYYFFYKNNRVTLADTITILDLGATIKFQRLDNRMCFSNKDKFASTRSDGKFVFEVEKINAWEIHTIDTHFVADEASSIN